MDLTDSYGTHVSKLSYRKVHHMCECICVHAHVTAPVNTYNRNKPKI